MKLIIILLIIAIVITTLKCFSYYCATRGLLYYLGSKYGDMLSGEKAKELTLMAMKRTIKEFFGKV